MRFDLIFSFETRYSGALLRQNEPLALSTLVEVPFFCVYVSTLIEADINVGVFHLYVIDCCQAKDQWSHHIQFLPKLNAFTTFDTFWEIFSWTQTQPKKINPTLSKSLSLAFPLWCTFKSSWITTLPPYTRRLVSPNLPPQKKLRRHVNIRLAFHPFMTVLA